MTEISPQARLDLLLLDLETKVEAGEMDEMEARLKFVEAHLGLLGIEGTDDT